MESFNDRFKHGEEPKPQGATREQRLLLGVLGVVLGLILLYRVVGPGAAPVPTPPPSSIEFSDLREVEEGGGARLLGVVTNGTGRVVERALYQVSYTDQYPSFPTLLEVINLKPGEKREFTLPLLRGTGPLKTRVVTPFSVTWGKS